VKLLLDELYSRQIAERRRARGRDVVSAKERDDLEGLLDERLFPLMPAERRAILSENWGDYDRLIRQAQAEGTTRFGVVFGL
jgi:hypothetical protein